MKTAILYNGISFQHYFLEMKDGKYKDRFTDRIYILDIPSTDFSQYDYIMVPARMNQDILLENKKIFSDYLAQGGHIVSFGEIVRPWLENVKWLSYPVNFFWWQWEGSDLPLYKVDPENDLWKHIGISDAKWHYHGVFLPEDDQDKIIVNEIGESILYVDRSTSQGNVYLTTLDPEYHLGQGFMMQTETFLDGYLNWIEEDINKLKNMSKIKPITLK